MRPPKTPRLDDTPSSDGHRSSNGAIPVVGIGSSAGGIDALRTLIPGIQPDTGLAYVVVQHLDPDHASKLTELLGRVSQIPVTEIGTETQIESDRVYVLPPNAGVTIEEDRLVLSVPAKALGYRAPIDGFLTSLAEAKGELAACVILSGTGSDGTLGLRAIKEHGGFTLAQDGAEYDGMMRSALSTGLVDFVLPAADISAKLTGYFRHMNGAGLNGTAVSALVDQIPEICRLLRARTGHDFSGYKDRTITRRVQRRMQVLQSASPADFVTLLRKQPQELDALLQDLLIGVTNFFRDAESFVALERDVIPKLFEGKGPDDSVRVWVPACSTGEEAFSIAILLKEYAADRSGKPKLQIFASDIDEQSLQIARMGRYPAAIAKDVPQGRLDRHFVREDGTYRIANDLREMCLFSQHNLLRDAPFSKLDLVSCRNLLIYLTGDLQNRLIPLFHYALNPGGFLFLGSSENVTRHTRLFETEDKTHRIFRRRHLLERRLPEFPLTAPDRVRTSLPQTGRPVAEQETLQGVAERQLLDRYAPPYVIINIDGELVHASTRTGKYLELAAGVLKSDVFGMARRGLRAELRAGVHKAAATGTPVVQPNVTVGTNGGRQNLNLIVHPIRAAEGQSSLFMVVFQDAGPLQAIREEGEPVALEEIESSTVQQLEAELRSIKDRLQTTTEELESSNEELKSGNEELSSMNEELQSANEELETSKEELQSINEELQTVNAELNARVEELSRANSDIANLLESTQIATVFLDRGLTIKSFTPAAKDVFRLVESDTGRPITHVRARFTLDTIQEDAERVLRTLGSIERQVQSTHNGARYVMRVLPYRTVNNVISGVVITFTDVTKISAAEARIDELAEDLRERMQNLETLIDMVPVGILFMEDSRSGMVKVNHSGAQLLGETVEAPGLSPVRTNWQMVENGRPVSPDDQPVQRALRTGAPVPSFEGELIRADGKRIPVLLSATPLLGADGKSRGAIAAILDISQRKRDEAQQQVLLHELQHRVKNIITTIGAL
jgi:two-component system CheB/CheR fusion protein